MSPAPKVATVSPDEVARQSKSNFLTSFIFLSGERRQGLSTIYAFCRAVDDAVDDAPSRDEAVAQVAFWRAELDRVESGEGEPESEIGRSLAQVVQRFGVPLVHLRELIDGVAMDLDPRRFADLDELDGYCHKVASAVGLACLPVFGAEGPDAVAYACSLGLSLQLTNVLRDIREDAEGGRVYLPLDRLAAHGVAPDWLDGSGPAEVYEPGGAVDSLVAEFTAIAQQRFARTAELLPADQRRALLAPEVMGAVYADVLDQVEERGGRIDRAERLRVPRRRKLWLAFRTWLRGRR